MARMRLIVDRWLAVNAVPVRDEVILHRGRYGVQAFLTFSERMGAWISPS
jgi:hypothetical protein